MSTCRYCSHAPATHVVVYERATDVWSADIKTQHAQITNVPVVPYACKSCACAVAQEQQARDAKTPSHGEIT